MSGFSTGGVHVVECHQRPHLWLPARHLEDALLFSAPPVHPVWSATLLADFPAALVPMEVLLPWRLVERLTPGGGSLRFRWPAHLCAAGTMCAVCRDLQQPSEPTPTCAVQSGTGADPSDAHRVSVRIAHLVSVLPQVASLIGSSSILFCGVLSENMEDFAAFQAFSVLVAVLSCGCMLYTGFYSQSRYDSKGCSLDGVCVADQTSPVSFAMLRTLMWQILTNRDFQLFVIMNFFQVFMLAFLSNFTMIFTEHLIPADVLPPLAKSVMYGAGFICPQVPSAPAGNHPAIHSLLCCSVLTVPVSSSCWY